MEHPHLPALFIPLWGEGAQGREYGSWAKQMETRYPVGWPTDCGSGRIVGEAQGKTAWSKPPAEARTKSYEGMNEQR